MSIVQPKNLIIHYRFERFRDSKIQKRANETEKWTRWDFGVDNKYEYLYVPSSHLEVGLQ